MKTIRRPKIFCLLALGLGAALAGTSRAPAAESEAAEAAYKAVALGDRINIRSQATTHSEVLGQLKRGDTVTVRQTITLSKPKEGDSTNWCKIALPAGTPVWVNAAFVDTNLMAVSTRKLNLRGGAGENFSVIGTLARGEAIKQVGRKDDWIQIETPAAAFGFVAAEYLQKAEAPPTPPPTPPVTVPVEPPPPPTPPATETKTNATPPATVVVPPLPETNAPATPPATTVVIPPLPVVPDYIKEEADAKERNLAKIRGFKTPPPPSPVATPVEPVIESAPGAPKRVVTREGIVRFTANLNSPSWFELEAVDTGKIINYLYTSDTNIVLKTFKGKKVSVTGEEGLDRRWPNTPVIKIESIKALP